MALSGDFAWRVPQLGFRCEWAYWAACGSRYARSRPGFDAFDGEREFIVANLIALAADEDEELRASPVQDVGFLLSGHFPLTYRPLIEFPALFREFAYLDRAHFESASLAFAGRWGALGSEATCAVRPRCPQGDVAAGSDDEVWGEALDVWQFEADSLRYVIEIWEASKRGDHAPAEKSLRRNDLHASWVMVTDNSGFMREMTIAAPRYHFHRLRDIESAGSAAALKFVVQDLVNEGLYGRVIEQVGWSGDLERFEIEIVPTSLIGALWLQLANAVAAGYDYSRCDVCASWFEIAPRSGRPEKRYCSDACRMRAYRRRKSAKSASSSAVR